MLKVLKLLEKQSNLGNHEEWESLNIDYAHPQIERLWTTKGNNRIYLHRIYSCNNSKPLFHKHPWPCVVKLYEGAYEMGVGYGESDHEPNIAATLTLVAGSSYEMSHPDGWHYICPLTSECYSIMVTGKPYIENSPTEKPELRPLENKTKQRLLGKFQTLLKGYNS